MFVRVKESYARQDELFENSTKQVATNQNGSHGKKVQGSQQQNRHNQSQPSQTNTITGSVNENGRFSSIANIGGGNSSMLTADSINVRKLTQMGVRSSGFFSQKDETAQFVAKMAHKKLN